MKLDKVLENALFEYIGMIDKGTIDMGGLELALDVLSSKDEARRLARRVMQAKPNEIKKALALGKNHAGMAHWFVQALEEKPKVKV